MFREVRDLADDVFCSLPPPSRAPPKDSWAAVRPQYEPAQVVDVPFVDMRAFNDRDNPCFHGDCLVYLAEGGTKKVRDVSRGDRVLGLDNVVEEILCVVRTDLGALGKTDLVELQAEGRSDVLLVTPWHPLFINGRWRFPVQISSAPRQRSCDSLFSFVLAPSASYSDGIRGSVVVSGFPAATLGHGIKGDDVLSHDFYGTGAVLDSLASNFSEGWNIGYITLAANSVIRGPDGLASGILPTVHNFETNTRQTQQSCV